MPKHVFEKADDPVAFQFNPPVSLGAYVLKDYDKAGGWFLWQRREDWQKTSVAKFGMPGPKYALYVDPGLTSDQRVIAQINHNLDVIHDIAPEGMITLAKGIRRPEAGLKASLGPSGSDSAGNNSQQ